MPCDLTTGVITAWLESLPLAPTDGQYLNHHGYWLGPNALLQQYLPVPHHGNSCRYRRKSLTSASLLVAWRVTANSISSGWIPRPLSLTWIAQTTLFNMHTDLGCTCVNCIFNQLFHHGCWTCDTSPAAIWLISRESLIAVWFVCLIDYLTFRQAYPAVANRLVYRHFLGAWSLNPAH